MSICPLCQSAGTLVITVYADNGTLINRHAVCPACKGTGESS